ncbi:S-adenosyl-L-methionine-dependent methyltransferase [Coccomyxa subellipsoidea C-169]|uniref:S-adenosyl-L-methionine-dependent methyltransferase n=1 Tax=Coccomyxa subellipsoidea (strain C-169) TaxID=574566 RepID=I0Z1C3_COCSC|nr:S-adenosyl-L-methionine-dependent methyltransferase [Coccomyxa subellipsoidea C-169]EIE24442.1 S-adenosyl-L-methionine-dependent methyltransferase [Coccomyxa subellipsoidea C-169]|eukprot:XP_005648986.1 S-adenosyl-L-methionine-dependent methyltransferase [Coccomyxa subellipsoidea C-169]
MDLETCKIKQTQATAWGNGAELYAANLHEGSGIMMPLIAAYAETARAEVKGNPLILDVASGTGEPGISLARQFPNGSVIMTDLADGMIAGAKGRAERLSVKNASFDVADAEDLSQFKDATFDVVTCNCGLMFMPNYERALAEFRRVLKPDGLALMSAWGLPEHTQLISLMLGMQAAVAPNDSLFADPNILGSREKLVHAVERAGFSNVSCREVNVPMHIPADKVRVALVQNPLIRRMAGAAD